MSMMKRLWIALAFAGCAAEDAVVAARMQLDAASGLDPADVRSVVVMVLAGPQANCKRALTANSPLDDPELEIVRHALFHVDGTAKHLSIPAGRKLAFYLDAYRSEDGTGSRIGRGCAEAELEAGRSTGVTITISAD
jgi:hypothetical protein